METSGTTAENSCPHEVSLQGRSLEANKVPPSVKGAVLHSRCLSAYEKSEFVWFVDQVRRYEWSPAFGRFEKPAHDITWNYTFHWNERIHIAEKRAEETAVEPEPIELVVLTALHHLQGIMIAGPSEEVNLPPSSTDRLLYIAYMATAPWNREPFLPPLGLVPSSLKGVGKALVKQAVCLSRQLGYGGRIGLRAMGRSAAFYRKIGMARVKGKVKCSEYPGDPWFELTEQGAEALLPPSP